MIYSNLYTGGHNKKIPTLVGVIIIFLVVGFFLTLMNKSSLPSRASKISVKRTEVTNLSPIQATIYWQTEVAEKGWIIYGENSDRLTKLAFDDRDVSDHKQSYINHYVTLKNLKPGGHYYYTLISNNKKIVKPDGTLFEFYTPLNSLAKTKIGPATGKVLKANLNPLKNAIVLLFVDEKTMPLSTMTKDSGEWLIPLNTFYDKSTLEEKNLSGKERVRVEIISETEGISTIISNLSDLALKEATSIIGKNYNFIESNDVLSASTNFESANDGIGIKIVYPLEGSLIPGRRPLIKGIALPGTEVSITINSAKTFSAKVRADKDGNWSYLIPEDLDLGKHTITVKVRNKKGRETISTRSFSIIANEGNDGKVLGTASAEPTMTYAPTSTPTQAPLLQSTATPIPTLKKAGVNNLLPIISGIALVIIGGGILLIF